MSEFGAKPWMVYGAYGVTGRLIVKAAIQRGHRPILAGRNSEKLATVAREFGLPSIVISLDQSEPLRAALRSARLIIHAAGPFVQTGHPVLQACLETRTPYVDVSGEAAYLRTVLAFDPQARSVGIPLLTAAGYGATYGDCLARHVVDRLPDACHLRISVAAENAYNTTAVRRTVMSVVAEGGAVIQGGEWSSRPLAHETWTVRHEDTNITFAAAPLPELLAASLSTGVPNIVVGRPMSATAARLARVMTPVLRGVLGVPSLRRRLERSKKTSEAAPDETHGYRSRIWAEAVNGRGHRAVALLETKEGYAAAALAAVVNAEALLNRQLVGVLTPASAFGAAHLATIPDTRLLDLDFASVYTKRTLTTTPVTALQ